MCDIREKVAHAMWLEQAKRAGTPSVIAGRTPIAFANTADQTRREWLGYADAALAVIPAPAVPDDVAGRATREALDYITAEAISLRERAEKAEDDNRNLRAALERCLNFIDNTECELGMTLECGDIARAALTQPTGGEA